MSRPAFGQRNVKEYVYSRDMSLVEHAQAAKKKSRAGKRRRLPLLDRFLTWFSYFTLVFTAVVTFAPDAAATAVLAVRQIAT